MPATLAANRRERQPAGAGVLPRGGARTFRSSPSCRGMRSGRSRPESRAGPARARARAGYVEGRGRRAGSKGGVEGRGRRAGSKGRPRIAARTPYTGERAAPVRRYRPSASPRTQSTRERSPRSRGGSGRTSTSMSRTSSGSPPAARRRLCSGGTRSSPLPCAIHTGTPARQLRRKAVEQGRLGEEEGRPRPVTALKERHRHRPPRTRSRRARPGRVPRRAGPRAAPRIPRSPRCPWPG